MFKRTSKKIDIPSEVEDSNDVSSMQESIQNSTVILTNEAGMADELDRVRSLLFGKQIKATDERLAQLENRVEEVRRELTNMLDANFTELKNSIASQLGTLQKDLVEQQDQHVSKQQADLGSVRQLLTERIDQQEKDQTEKLRTAQRTLSDRIDTIANDHTSQLKKMQLDLSTRIETLNAEQSTRIGSLQQESSQRDDALSNELMALGRVLGSQKVSRREMMHFLAELAQRFQVEDERTT